MAEKQEAKQKEIREYPTGPAESEYSEPKKRSPVITLRYCNYVLKRLWEDDLQLDRKINELKKARKDIGFDVNSAAEYMCFYKTILPYSEGYGQNERNSFLGNPAGNVEYDDFESTFYFLEDNQKELISWVKSVLGNRYNTASLLRPIKNRWLSYSLAKRDKTALTRLSALLLRLLLQKLSGLGCHYRISEIPAYLRNAAVVLLNAEEGKKNEEIVFIASEPQEVMMKVNGRMPRQKTIDDMLMAVGLEPLPASGTLAEAGRRLKAGFKSLDDAVSPLFFLKF